MTTAHQSTATNGSSILGNTMQGGECESPDMSPAKRPVDKSFLNKNDAKPMPSAIAGMVTITKDAFYATVGRLDVNPSIVGGYDRTYGYLQHWLLRDRSQIGATYGGTCFSQRRYMVTRQFFDANRVQIEAFGAVELEGKL